MIYRYATLQWKKEDSSSEQSDKVSIRSLIKTLLIKNSHRKKKKNGITFENMFVRLGSDREKETKYFKRDLDNHIWKSKIKVKTQKMKRLVRNQITKTDTKIDKTY